MICMNTCVIARVVYVYPLQVHLPSPPISLECAPCLNLSTDAPIHYDPASTWIWTHNICTLSSLTWHILHHIWPHTTVSRHRFWSTIRYVKVSCKFVNPPRHGSYGRLEEDKRVCLKTRSICHPPRSWPQHLFEILAITTEKRDVIDVVRLFLQCATHVGCLLSSLLPLPWPSPPY